MLYTASIRYLPSASPAAVQQWHLDTPLHERPVDLQDTGLNVQGWLLCREAPAQPPTLLWRLPQARHRVFRHRFNADRPDVIRHVLSAPSEGHPRLRCGFSVRIPMEEQVELGFELPSGEAWWVAAVTLSTAMKVLEGEDRWLFLDNDTNRSVDQYTGRLLLDDQGLQRWRDFLDATRALAAQVQARHAVVVAPSKEEVMRHRYPHQRAAVTVLDQVRALARPEDHLLDTAPLLRKHRPPGACFKRTDTHWTDRGAMLATLATMSKLGFDAQTAQDFFAADAYVKRSFAGDLGLKLIPPRKALTEFLGVPHAPARTVFDNKLPNFGRVMIFQQAMPCFDSRALVFGASSAYVMLQYLSRLFRRTVFIHSGASVDEAVVQHERPDVLVLQSNGRFLIVPPTLDFDLRRSVAAKFKEAPPAVREHVSQLRQSKPASEADDFYYRMLEAVNAPV